MKTEALGFLPKARSEGLITKEVDGELLIYDRIRDKAHCLNQTAASIWRHCDGHTRPHEIARLLSNDRNNRSTEDSLDESVVWLALTELRRSHLLDKPKDKGPSPQAILGMSLMSRREAVRRIGLGTAITLPIVATMTAPTPAQAGTCRPNGASCGTGSQCCSGTCVGGQCLGPINREEKTRYR
jgi:hypothetical protein